MFRPRKKLVLQIALILIILSVGLFVYSASEIHSSVSTSSASIGVAKEFNISRNASAGFYLEYSITATPSNHDILVYLISPTGAHTQGKYFSNTNGGSSVFIANSSGTWRLVVVNAGNSSATVSASFGTINQNVIYGTIVGFISIISGAVLIFLYVYSRAMQKKRERLRGFSE
jgi:hypothetical protein